MPGAAYEILLVEDDAADASLTRQAFQESGIPHRIVTVPDGEQALRYLRRSGEYASVDRPDLVLMDLNLPKLDGRETLAQIKDDPELRNIPVIVMTTSTSNRDVSEVYQLHANCYLTKPTDVDEFVRKIRSFEEFWLNIVRLPGRT